MLRSRGNIVECGKAGALECEKRPILCDYPSVVATVDKSVTDMCTATRLHGHTKEPSSRFRGSVHQKGEKKEKKRGIPSLCLVKCKRCNSVTVFIQNTMVHQHQHPLPLPIFLFISEFSKKSSNYCIKCNS